MNAKNLGVFPRLSSQFYTLGPILDQNGGPFKPNYAYLTLYDEASGAIINSRDHFDVIGRWGFDGVFTFEFLPADLELLNDKKQQEKRRCLIEWWYGSVNERRGEHEFRFIIDNVPKIYLGVPPIP